MRRGAPTCPSHLILGGRREALMKVEKVGEDGMKLITTDVDPQTGQPVITGEITLSRV